LRFLQTYLNGHKWGLVSDDDFLAALHVVGNSELIRLFEEWVGEEAMQATQPDAATGN
jgi:aminopeptidase N